MKNNIEIDGSIYFLKLFRNIVIRNNIFRYIKLYNLNRLKTVSIESDNNKNAANKEYIEYLFISDSYMDLNKILNNLSTSVRVITFHGYKDRNKGLKQFPKMRKISNCDNINKLSISFDGFDLTNISNDLFPKNLKSLVFPVNFKTIIEPGILPESITDLHLGFEYKMKIKSFPNSLTSLVTNLESIKSSELPQTLKKLFIYGVNNSDISQPLPSSIKFLSLWDYSLDTISKEWLPTNLETLSIISKTNKIINLISVPETLKTFQINSHISFCDSNQTKCLLPNNLRKLKIPKIKLYPNCSLPLNLKVLKFSSYLEGNKDSVFKNGILPPNLKSLHLVNGQRISKESLPSSLLKISGINTFQQLFSLPQSITKIKFIDSYDKPSFSILPASLPKSLKTLILNDQYNYEIRSGTLPSTLEYLEFGLGFNKVGSMINTLPRNLKSLVLPFGYYSSVTYKTDDGGFKIIKEPIKLPCDNSLTALKFRLTTDEVLIASKLPPSLTLLDIYTNQIIDTIEFPKSLTTLIVRVPPKIPSPISPHLKSIIIVGDFDLKDINPDIISILHLVPNVLHENTFKKILYKNQKKLY